MTRPPPPPERVRLARADGSEIPLEVVYTGTRWEGGRRIRNWRAVLLVRARPGDRLLIGALPPRTAVEAYFAAGTEP